MGGRPNRIPKADDRDREAWGRDDEADARDADAEIRDQLAGARDGDAVQRDRLFASEADAVRRLLSDSECEEIETEEPATTAGAGGLAAADRAEQAAVDGAVAETERRLAADAIRESLDRMGTFMSRSILDRQLADLDRQAAARDRRSAAGDRSASSADRDQAAVERAQGPDDSDPA